MFNVIMFLIKTQRWTAVVFTAVYPVPTIRCVGPTHYLSQNTTET